jgi:Protein of unknown function (DUF2905)
MRIVSLLHNGSDREPSPAAVATAVLDWDEVIIMQRILVITGCLLLVAGLGWRYVGRIPFGHLPGDIHIVRNGFSFHFPIVTCIVISIALSLLIWIFRR